MVMMPARAALARPFLAPPPPVPSVSAFPARALRRPLRVRTALSRPRAPARARLARAVRPGRCVGAEPIRAGATLVRPVAPLCKTAHAYIGQIYIGHNYVGHNYIGRAALKTAMAAMPI